MDGTEHALFYDSYALLAIALGQESYREYAVQKQIYTTLMNLYETYYILLQKNLALDAEKVFERFLPFCVTIEPEKIKEAAHFRLLNAKKKLSYVDALGYVVAGTMNVKFLTGDDGFAGMPMVKFVK